MKPEELATIINMLRDITEKLEEDMKGEFKAAEHVDDKQYEIDNTQVEEVLSIKDLKEGDDKIKLTARVTSISDKTSFDTKDGGKGKVCTLTVSDISGSIDIPLFDEEIMFVDNLKVLQLVDIEAWKVTEYKNKLQLKLGKYGNIFPAGQTELKE